MTYPILSSIRNFRSRLSICSGFLSGVEVRILLTINLYASLQELEDYTNFWLRESWSGFGVHRIPGPENTFGISPSG